MELLPSDRDRRMPFVLTSAAAKDRKKLKREMQEDDMDAAGDSGISGEGRLTKVQMQVEHAKKIIKQFDFPSYDFLAHLDNDQNDESEEEEEEEEDESEDEEEDDDDYDVEDDDLKGEEGKKMKSGESNVDNNDDDTDDDDESANLEVDAKVFDNLDWDVECTEEVWNLLRAQKDRTRKEKNDGEKELRKERVTDAVKRLVVNKIQMLASGNWRSNLQVSGILFLPTGHY